MKTSLKVFLASLVLLTQGFGQEPKQALAKQVSIAAGKTETIASGAPQPVAPVVEPKALPPLNPPLGDMARQARAARAAAPKAIECRRAFMITRSNEIAIRRRAAMIADQSTKACSIERWVSGIYARIKLGG